MRNSLETATWVARQGVKLQPGLGRQAYKVDGKFKFWGGLALHIWGGGPEMLKALYGNAERRGIPIVYETPPLSLIREGGRVPAWWPSIMASRSRSRRARSCSPAAASNSIPRCARAISGRAGNSRRSAARASTWGPASTWHSPRRAALGNWSGCHSVAWDINAPPYGDLTIGDQFQKHNYPFGIIVNAKGERYVDEGANFHSHTYAKYGGEILRQPGMFAWQVFDAKASQLLRSEYRIRRVTKAEADTLEELATKLEGVDRKGSSRPCAPSTPRAAAKCRSIPTYWTAAAPRG